MFISQTILITYKRKNCRKFNNLKKKLMLFLKCTVFTFFARNDQEYHEWSMKFLTYGAVCGSKIFQIRVVLYLHMFF